jgi:hypothetical protein
MRPRTSILGIALIAGLIAAVSIASLRRPQGSIAVPVSVGAVRHEAIDVSMIRLIAAPQEYSKKVIRVIGYLNIEFEGNAVYLHKEDFERSLTTNAIWVDAKPEIMKDLKKLSGQYVLLEGVFEGSDHGHMGLFSGALREIHRGDAWAFTRAAK